MFRKIEFKEAMKRSYEMSFLSIIIMMTVAYGIMFLEQAVNSSHQMQMEKNPLDSFWAMVIPMIMGFFVTLPYNYYQIEKTGKACH